MNIRKFKSDVRGAALVYVIVAAAIVILLGAATTATAYVNLRTTQIQEKSDNNFYNADGIMNAIRSGLESDMSRAYEAAYTEVITKLDTYATDDEAVKDFSTIFLNHLNSTLNDGNESFEFFYSAAHLKSYVEAVYGDDVRYTITAINGDNYIDLVDGGIVLRNIHVTYEDDTGYFDEINTDVKLLVPDFDVPRDLIDGEISNVVIDEGVQVNENNGLSFVGDVFVNERDSDKSAVLLKVGSALNITSPYRIVLGGLIKTEGNNTLNIDAMDETQRPVIWTENFDIGRNTTAQLTGTFAVLDDLEINGSNSTVKLVGQYFGYSKHSSDADWSSSININGAHATLDISQIDNMVIAGTSYISTSSVPFDGTYNNETDIQLGEGLSVKSNQIAYLVDDKEFKHTYEEDLADVYMFVSNPMSYNQYETMIQKNGGLDKVVSKIITKPLSYDGAPTYASLGASVVPVFSNKDGGTVYLYLSFDNPSKAAAYFEMAYKGNTQLSQRLRTYAGEYITNLMLNPDTKLTVNENYIDTTIALYDPEILRLTMSGLGYNKDQHAPSPDKQLDVDAAMKQYADAYGFYDDRETATTEKYSNSFGRIIHASNFVDFIREATTSDKNTNTKIEKIENGVIISGTSDAKAILVDNKNAGTYVLEGGKGMLIASGDVEITGDWTGRIIVGGRLTCKSGSPMDPIVITEDENIAGSVSSLYYTIAEGGTVRGMQVLNVFKKFADVTPNYATQDEGNDADMISKCVIFSNWNRY